MPHYEIHFTLLEDLHLGTGTGLADIDSLQARDRTGRPCLPATHIKGVMRAAAEELSQIDPTAFESDEVDRLFGRAGSQRGQLQLTSAILVPDAQPDCLVWGTTQIDPETGSARDDSLHFIEFARAGSKFSAYAEVADPKLAEVFLLILHRCDRFGGNRSRGSGLIQIECSPVTSSPPALTDITAQTVTMKLLLRALDPICLPITGEPGNIIPSDSFIRGQSLLGAIAAWGISHDHPEIADRLFSGAVSVGDALPLPGDATTVQLGSCDLLPIPLNLLTPKPGKAGAEYLHDLPWWAQIQAANRLGDRCEYDKLDPTATKRDEKPKRPSAHEYIFLADETSGWQRYKPEIGMRLRARVPDTKRNLDQALFSNEEIAEDTLFLTELHFTDAHTATAFEGDLKDIHSAQGWLRIGRGGRPVAIEAWQWCPLHFVPTAKDDTLAFTLTSDLVARDSLLNFETSLTPSLLAHLAGVAAQDITINRWESVCDSQTLRGFNVMTGLPRPARIAIRRGSSIRLTGTGLTKLSTALAAHRALGEDTHEGLGRFRLDFQALCSTPSSPTSPVLEERMEENLLSEARKIAGHLHGPSHSQWGQFRDRILAARNRADLDGVFQQIRMAAEKHGGAGWKRLLEGKDFKEVERRAGELDLHHARLYLDALVRWWRANHSKDNS